DAGMSIGTTCEEPMTATGERSWTGAVDDLRRATTARGRARLGEFAIEGVRLVERAIRAGSAPRRLIVSQRLLRQKDERTRAVLSELEQIGRASCREREETAGVVGAVKTNDGAAMNASALT